MENPNLDSVQVCYNFFQKAFPISQPKNFRTQLGILLEEVAELINEIEPAEPQDQAALGLLHTAIHHMGEHLKTQNGVLGIKSRTGLLDGICDVMVTAIGLGKHAHMDVHLGFIEVNRSNNSKFGENGEPIYDGNLKLIKGPNYSKPNLENFV